MARLLATTVTSREWETHRVNNTTFPLAVCLDGTPGAYSVREGMPENEKVLFFFEGGGWCSLLNGTTIESCLRRTKTAVGTGSACTTCDATGGYMSIDPVINPAFHDWTIVYAHYCDGASFSGRLLDPVEVTGGDGTTTPLYFRGNYILEAITTEALSSINRNISHLVIGGASSGALAACLHGEQIMELVQPLQLKEETQFAYFLEGGFFPDWDEPTYPLSPISPLTFSGWMKDVYNLNNATDSLPKKCIEETDEENHFRCMFPENILPGLEKPYFVFQADYELYQIPFILGWNNVDIGTDDPGPPLIPWSNVTDYAQNLRNLLLSSTKNPEISPTGIFVPACMMHCAFQHGTYDSDLYVNTTVNDLAYNTALAKWLNEWLDSTELPPASQGGHYKWIHGENELPFTVEQCAAGLTKDMDTSVGSNRNVPHLLPWLLATVVLIKFF